MYVKNWPQYVNYQQNLENDNKWMAVLNSWNGLGFKNHFEICAYAQQISYQMIFSPDTSFS